MKRLLLLTAAGLTVVALAGAVGLPDLAGAQDAAPDAGLDHRQRRRHGRRRAERGDRCRSAPRRAGQRLRRPSPPTPTRCARSSTRSARRAGASSRRSGSASTRTRTRPARSTDTRRRTASPPSATSATRRRSSTRPPKPAPTRSPGPGLSSSNAEALYRQALAKAVDEARLQRRGAREGRRPLARLDHHDRRGRCRRRRAALRRGARLRTPPRRSSLASRRRPRPSASPSPSAEQSDTEAPPFWPAAPRSDRTPRG